MLRSRPCAKERNDQAPLSISKRKRRLKPIRRVTIGSCQEEDWQLAKSIARDSNRAHYICNRSATACGDLVWTQTESRRLRANATH
jgi:hypothetical protein